MGRGGKDVLLVNINDPASETNKPTVYAGDVSGIKNWPDDSYTSGEVVAYRLVMPMNIWGANMSHFGVALFEMFPKRRLWLNFYNVNAWSGWSQA